MYVAVKGGEAAILNSYRLLAQQRRGDPAVAELSIAHITQQLRLAVDRVMTEGSVYDPELAALAIKQSAGDLVEATHDALLARLRNVLRRNHGYPRAVDEQGQTRKRPAKLGVRVLWVDQPTILPAAWQQNDPLQGLSCAGYGSSVNVTASMGFAAANLVVQQLLAHYPKN